MHEGGGRILLAGVGRVPMGDDGIGPYCVHHLVTNVAFPPNVEIADVGTRGLDLALHLSTADHVLLVDALRGVKPGTIAAYDEEVMEGSCPYRIDTHAPVLAESLFIARLAGGRPRDVRLIGLGGASFNPGTTVSTIVRARMPALISRVLQELTRLGVDWSHRQSAKRTSPWWESQTTPDWRRRCKQMFAL